MLPTPLYSKHLFASALCYVLRRLSLATERLVRLRSNKIPIDWKTRGGVTFRASRPSTFTPSAPLVFLLLARMVATPGFLQLVGAPLFMFSTLLFFFPRRPVTFLVPAVPVGHAPLQALAYLIGMGARHSSHSQSKGWDRQSSVGSLKTATGAGSRSAIAECPSTALTT